MSLSGLTKQPKYGILGGQLMTKTYEDNPDHLSDCRRAVRRFYDGKGDR
jgi:hypothetical protein